MRGTRAPCGRRHALSQFALRNRPHLADRSVLMQTLRARLEPLLGSVPKQTSASELRYSVQQGDWDIETWIELRNLEAWPGIRYHHLVFRRDMKRKEIEKFGCRIPHTRTPSQGWTSVCQWMGLPMMHLSVSLVEDVEPGIDSLVRVVALFLHAMETQLADLAIG